MVGRVGMDSEEGEEGGEEEEDGSGGEVVATRGELGGGMGADNFGGGLSKERG